MRVPTVRLVCGLSLLAASFVIGGCATTANPQAMTTAAPIKVAKQHPYTVNVSTSGGTASVTTGSDIADPEFKTAIETSINESKVFKATVNDKSEQYQLTAKVITVDKPMFGASFTVTLETGWTLTRTSDKQIFYRQVIKTQHTATMSDAFVGMKRLQLAVEGAARKNIEQAVTEIGSLPISSNVASAK